MGAVRVSTDTGTIITVAGFPAPLGTSRESECSRLSRPVHRRGWKIRPATHDTATAHTGNRTIGQATHSPSGSTTRVGQYTGAVSAPCSLRTPLPFTASTRDNGNLTPQPSTPRSSTARCHFGCRRRPRSRTAVDSVRLVPSVDLCNPHNRRVPAWIC